MDFNDFINGKYSDYCSLATRSYFEQQRDELENELREREEKKASFLAFSKQVTEEAIKLGLLDQLEAEFLETPTICSLIREYKKAMK